MTVMVRTSKSEATLIKSSNLILPSLEEALARYGRPEIFNTDQGSRFTSDDFTATLKRHEIAISMDGKGGAFVWLPAGSFSVARPIPDCPSAEPEPHPECRRKH